MADLGQAYVQIIPKAEGISGQITNVLSGEAGAAGTKVGGLFTKGFGGKLAKGAAIAGTTLAAGLAVGSAALKKGIQETAAYGDNVDKMSQKIGFSAEEYQKWDYVLQRAGTDIGKMAPVMKTLSSQAANNSEAFQKLGISQEQVASMSQGELFSKTIEQLSQMEDKTQRTALASQLLGRGATELGPLLNEGSDALREQMDIAEKYGMVMSDATVKASADFTDSVTTMQMTMTGLKNRMMGEFLPAATMVTDGIGKMFAGDMSGVDDIVDGIEGIASKAAEIAPKILKTGADLIGQLIKGIMSRSGEIGENAGSIITTIVSTLIEKMPDILKGGMNLIIGLATGLLSGLPKIVTAVGRIALTVVSGLGSAIWGKVRVAAEGVKERFLAPINTLRENVKSIIDKIKGFFSFEIKAPHVPLPHFSITPSGWKLGDLLKGVKPSLGISWYAKGGIFDEPTIAGIGERGPEAVVPLDKLWDKLDRMEGGSIVINLNYDASNDANDMLRDLVRGVQRYKMAGAI